MNTVAESLTLPVQIENHLMDYGNKRTQETWSLCTFLCMELGGSNLCQIWGSNGSVTAPANSMGPFPFSFKFEFCKYMKYTTLEVCANGKHASKHLSTKVTLEIAFLPMLL